MVAMDPRWQRFPVGRARVDANRRIDRWASVAYCAWYVLIVVPWLGALALTARVGPFLGFVLLVAATTYLLLGTVSFRWPKGRMALNQDSMLDGHALSWPVSDTRTEHYDLDAGRASLVRHPRTLGAAVVLAYRYPRGSIAVICLTDPGTGEPRDRAFLRQLAEVLAGSPHPADRETGLDVSALATRAADLPADQLWEPDQLPAPVWSTLKSLGRHLVRLAALPPDQVHHRPGLGRAPAGGTRSPAVSTGSRRGLRAF